MSLQSFKLLMGLLFWIAFKLDGRGSASSKILNDINREYNEHVHYWDVR